MSHPTVTTVIATRDRPEMLREAIEAVLSQDYPGAIEVVVVFDKSTPDPSIERDDTHRSVRVTTNSRIPGLAGARNTGIELASGELVAFCDDDDVWLPGKLVRQVDMMQGRRTSLVTCGIEIDYGDERHPRVLDLDEISFDELLRDRHTELHPSTFVMRRDDVVNGFGLVSEEVPGGFGEDYEFLLRASRFAPILNVRQPYTLVRWGRQSFFFRRWETMTDGLSWLLDRYPEFESVPPGSARIRGQIAFAQAALKNRRSALRWAGSAWRRNPLEPRALLAVAVATGLLSPNTVMEQLHKRGRGI
jgi:glycosyltransferase involved in cell wall biosynthesis